MSRARSPDATGEIVRDGVRVAYEIHGDAGPAVVLLPTWSIVHARHWKMQVPHLAHHCRVIVVEGRGNGRSDRPERGYEAAEFAADALAVMDATATPSATLVSLSIGAQRALLLAAGHPERVDGSVFIAPTLPLGDAPPGRARAQAHWNADLDAYEGWARYNRHSWLRDYRGFLEFFFAEMFPEPHSTKPIEDCVSWGLDTTPETLVATQLAAPLEEPEVRALCRRVRCPVLVISGTDDRIAGPARGSALAEATGGRLVRLEGSGHGPHVRDPVRVNALVREFVAPAPPPPRWARAHGRPERALYLSSPIGLGHARRDLAIAGALRALRPGLQIDWLAQHPVTAFLHARGERVHPASGRLAAECGHIEAASGEHELRCFEAIRQMDEILLANYMVFDDLVREETYDLWIGDEAWELDHHLHENPERKRAAYAWLTDFVGWLPTAAGGEREAFLTADANADMLEQVARYPRVRDRAIFLGDPEDIVPDGFGPGLPAIREWTEAHFDFPGYVVDAPAGERALLGYGDDERVCVVTTGGSGVGAALLRRVIAAFPEARERVPGLRMIVVAGPRLDLGEPPAQDGLELRAYVPDLDRHLAACDLAIVHGGLATTMELTAARRPFLYFPLRHHFEQERHVAWRLERHGSGRRMDFATAGPAEIAAAIAEEIGREADPLPVPGGGAERAARMIAELL